VTPTATPTPSVTPTITPTVTPTATAAATPTPTVAVGPTPRSGQTTLNAAKTASPNPVAPAGILTFVVTVTNTGSFDALAVAISDPLPPGTSYASCVASTGACLGPPVGTNGTVTAAFGTLAAGATATLTIQVQAPAAPGILTNVATVTAANVPGGSLTVTAVAGVGNGSVSDVPALGPGTLALLALALVWVGLRALRGLGT
jgi:uncharacterized repeat protein (TIGR01451 family)